MGQGPVIYLVAALWSDVWQKRKRTSFREVTNAYLADIAQYALVLY